MQLYCTSSQSLSKFLSDTWSRKKIEAKILMLYQSTLVTSWVRYQPSDINRTHWIGNKNKAPEKRRAIIINFARYNIKKKN